MCIIACLTLHCFELDCLDMNSKYRLFQVGPMAGFQMMHRLWCPEFDQHPLLQMHRMNYLNWPHSETT